MEKLTHIDIRVIAVDGKFLGDDISGAAITVRDFQTREILAQGVTKGDSGPNAKDGKGGVMCVSLKRGQPLPMDETTSCFTAKLLLSLPKRIEVTAFGPLGARASANTVSVTTWVYPGRDMTVGNGLLLEIPGLICQIINPPTHTTMSVDPASPANVEIVANVAMMCGCPIGEKKDNTICTCPGNEQPWLPEDFSVFAILTEVSSSPPVETSIELLWYKTDNVAGRFRACSSELGNGTYQMTVFAQQVSTGNTGVDFSAFVIQPKIPSSQ